jgi:hypothetical protein
MIFCPFGYVFKGDLWSEFFLFGTEIPWDRIGSILCRSAYSPCTAKYSLRFLLQSLRMRALRIMPRNLNEIVRSWIRLLHCFALSCTVQRCPSLSCPVLHCPELFSVVLHCPTGYTVLHFTVQSSLHSAGHSNIASDLLADLRKHIANLPNFTVLLYLGVARKPHSSSKLEIFFAC